MQTLAKRHPRFWRTQGNEPSNCELIVDEYITYNGQRSCFLRHSGTEPGDHGGLVQTTGAFDYRGKRLRFSAKVKLQNVKGKANLFVMILDSEPAVILKDEMTGRELSGTIGWTSLNIVIDVPKEARYINFGAMINEGPGDLWIADLTVSEVDKETPLTENGDNDKWVNKGPTNFELADGNAETGKVIGWRFHATPIKSCDFKSGLKQEDNRRALWISSEANLVQEQGEKSNSGGTFSQRFNGAPWRGKRIRFSADIKCDSVGDWCGLMMWAQDIQQKTLAFTTMYDFPLSGSSDWQTASVVLDVPPTASRIIVSMTLRGNGEAFFSNLSFSEAATADLPTDRRSRPKNLNFSE